MTVYSGRLRRRSDVVALSVLVVARREVCEVRAEKEGGVLSVGIKENAG